MIVETLELTQDRVRTAHLVERETERDEKTSKTTKTDDDGVKICKRKSRETFRVNWEEETDFFDLGEKSLLGFLKRERRAPNSDFKREERKKIKERENLGAKESILERERDAF